MQFVQNLKPLKKKDGYTTTNNTGVNGPTDQLPQRPTVHLPHM